MTPRLLLEPEAEAEFLEAARWYENRRAGLGGEFRASVEATLQVIEETPERFPIALRDIRKARVPRFPYVVYYVPMGGCRERHRDHPRAAQSRALAEAALMPNGRMELPAPRFKGSVMLCASDPAVAPGCTVRPRARRRSSCAIR